MFKAPRRCQRTSREGFLWHKAPRCSPKRPRPVKTRGGSHPGITPPRTQHRLGIHALPAVPGSPSARLLRPTALGTRPPRVLSAGWEAGLLKTTPPVPRASACPSHTASHEDPRTGSPRDLRPGMGVPGCAHHHAPSSASSVEGGVQEEGEREDIPPGRSGRHRPRSRRSGVRRACAHRGDGGLSRPQLWENPA